MTRTCKTCELPDQERQFIELLIKYGVSFKVIAKIAQKKGIDISHTSIYRHYKNHMPSNYTVGQIKERDKNVINYKENVIAGLQEAVGKLVSYGAAKKSFSDKELALLAGITDFIFELKNA